MLQDNLIFLLFCLILFDSEFRYFHVVTINTTTTASMACFIHLHNAAVVALRHHSGVHCKLVSDNRECGIVPA